MSSYEIEKAIFEHERNKAVDAYFAARPQIERTIDKERLVEAGFRMAWELRKFIELYDAEVTGK